MTTANASIDGRPGGLRHVGRSGLRAIFGTRDGRVGSALIAIVVAVALVGPALAPESPERTGVGPPSQGPSSAHPLGTDGRGSDVLSRVLSGGRRTVVLPLIATAVAFLVGGMIGITLGYLGGRPDLFGARVIDVLLGLPPLLVVLVILAGFGAGSGVVVIAVSLVFAPRIARILRGATQGVSTQDYVKAAQARGESTRGIVLWEVAPNITPTMLVEFALRLTYAIIFIASLSFLGLGVQPPTADWGLMAAENRGIITVNPWATAAPAILIGLLSVGVSFVADGVTQYLGVAVEREGPER